MDKKKIVIIVLASILLLSFAVFVPFVGQMIRLDRLGLEDKKIISAQMVVYGGEAFASNIISGETVTDESKLSALTSQLSMKKISLYNPVSASKLLFIVFEDGSFVNCFVAGDKIGFNYGEIWLKTDNLSEIFTNIL